MMPIYCVQFPEDTHDTGLELTALQLKCATEGFDTKRDYTLLSQFVTDPRFPFLEFMNLSNLVNFMKCYQYVLSDGMG